MQFMLSLMGMLLSTGAITRCAHADAETIQKQVDDVNDGNPKIALFTVSVNAANMVASRLVVEAPGYE
jgi:hypothetical protein